MSYAENLCESSLKLIFEGGVVMFRNHRPDWLKNPKTGKNLELDFYLPHIKTGIEIQGQHHYDDLNQIERDILKKDLLFDENVTLIKLSIFQINPGLLWEKIRNYTHLPQRVTLLKDYDRNWNGLIEIKEYRNKMLQLYGKSDCFLSPYINENRKKKPFIYNLDEKILSNIEYVYSIGRTNVKITPIEIVRKSVKCRILGTDKFIFLKKKYFIENLGLN